MTTSNGLNGSAPQRYNFEAKMKYRHQVWTAFRQILKYKTREKHALLMPAAEGLEIDVALEYGFLPSHLHVVDSNPAVVANLKRRYPTINTYGVTLDRALVKIADSGVQLSAANFDLSNALGQRALDTLVAIANTWCFTANAAVAVTVLRGREPKTMMQDLSLTQEILKIRQAAGLRPLPWEKSLDPQDAARITTIAATISGAMLTPDGQEVPTHHVLPTTWGSYVSVNGAHHSLLWVVCKAEILPAPKHKTLLAPRLTLK